MKKTTSFLVFCLLLGTMQAVQAEIKSEGLKPAEIVATNGIRFDYVGRVGNGNGSMTMYGNTGTYSYTTDDGIPSGKRTLKFVSYNRSTGRLILNAYARGKYIGKFDGTFDPRAGWYRGTFISVRGIRLSFEYGCYEGSRF